METTVMGYRDNPGTILIREFLTVPTLGSLVQVHLNPVIFFPKTQLPTSGVLFSEGFTLQGQPHTTSKQIGTTVSNAGISSVGNCVCSLFQASRESCSKKK